MNNISQPAMQPGAIEFFANNGKAYCEENGILAPLSECSVKAASLLRNKLEHDPGALSSLELAGITDPVQQLNQYAMCRYGERNNKADFIGFRENMDDAEFVQLHCGEPDCRYRGKLCHTIHTNMATFSDREVDILRWLGKNQTQIELAEKLGISIHTESVHMASILSKGNFKNAAAAAAWAAGHSL